MGVDEQEAMLRRIDGLLWDARRAVRDETVDAALASVEQAMDAVAAEITLHRMGQLPGGRD
jgi:hypothetical protein